MHRASFPPQLSDFYILLLHFKSQIQLEGKAAVQREGAPRPGESGWGKLPRGQQVPNKGRNTYCPCNSTGWGLFGSNSSGKDLVDNLNMSQQFALAAEANGIWSYINKRAGEADFHKTSSGHCVQFGVPSSTRTILM